MTEFVIMIAKFCHINALCPWMVLG